MIVKCDNCGKKFTKRQNKVRTHNYCCRACFLEDHRNAEVYFCVNCGKPVTKTPGKIVGKVYCSKECFYKVNNENLAKNAKERSNRVYGECNFCKKKISKRGGTPYKKTFCGNECRLKYESEHSKRNSRHPLYNTWKCMRYRCYNPNNHKYPDYGGRGIIVCDRWKKSFENFIADMGNTKPSQSHTLDRINNDGNYEPTNCRWATPLQQANNQRPKKRKNVKGN